MLADLDSVRSAISLLPRRGEVGLEWPTVDVLALLLEGRSEKYTEGGGGIGIAMAWWPLPRGIGPERVVLEAFVLESSECLFGSECRLVGPDRLEDNEEADDEDEGRCPLPFRLLEKSIVL